MIEPLMRAMDVWRGRFQLLYLGPFNERDSINMLKRLFEEGGIIISDEEAKVIAKVAGYHPFYMQYMRHHIYLAGRVDRISIRNAKQKLFEFVMPIFITYLNKLNELGREYMETLAKNIEK